MIHYLVFSCLMFFAEGSIFKNLQHFETVHADEVTHKIVKRGTPESTHPFNRIKEVNFKAHGRDFRLILSPKRSVLHSNFRAYEVDRNGKEKSVHIDHEDFYSGRVFGETDSHVSLHMEDKIMTGSIHLPDEIFHIEPSWRHIPDLDNRTMITYKQSDVKFSWDHENLPPGQPGPKICGYIKEDEDFTNEENQSHREKRELNENEFIPKKTKCPLLLVADFRFFLEMGGGNTKASINYLITLIDRVNKIYNDTVWQDQEESGGFKAMGFVIKKIIVHSEPTSVENGEVHYNMGTKEWDVRNLLEVFSRNPENKEVCLAHLFTHQTFKAKDSVVLGLAYISSPRKKSHGGICTADYVKDGYNLYLNSGLSSSRNYYGHRVITREADLVTAHEFGHNWGSEHDPDTSECAPSASHGGSYLMYTYSVSGYDINNKKFSPCSLRSIKKVLEHKSEYCFSEPEESFCGNLHVEGNEECDAGLVGTENNDICCDNECRLRRDTGAVCSDKNSPCCDKCQYLQNVICREAQKSTCEKESYCTGNDAECPKSQPMDDDTVCQEEGKCRGGKCMAFCETQNLESCMCDKIADSCKRCCRSRMNSTCEPVENANLVPDGTPCIQGFCNKGVCEKTVQDVVERLWDIIEDIDINKFLLFLKDNIVGTIICMTAIFWIPIGFVVNYVDRKRSRKELESDEWDEFEPYVLYGDIKPRVRTITEVSEEI